ncbi:MAG: hypothetical protein JSW68_09460 [Burkholderiales bacterium]|nr:MAG: hypothetical protein JSW68_09460 [Burkholderiales bacterium]
MRGRTRLRLIGGRGDFDALEALAQRLADIDGVLAVDARPATASVIVHHAVDFALVAGDAAARGMMTLVEREIGTRDPRRPSIALEPRQLAALGSAVALASLGIWQMARGALLPPALTLLVWAARRAGEAAEPGTAWIPGLDLDFDAGRRAEPDLHVASSADTDGGPD